MNGHLVFAMHSNVKHAKVYSITIDSQTIPSCISPSKSLRQQLQYLSTNPIHPNHLDKFVTNDYLDNVTNSLTNYYSQ
ncbi:unnamed protein product [Schistosoma bovis]|nr:unnamed protein product [Schistosoma bovis]